VKLTARPTQRALDAGDSAAFTSLSGSVASGFFCSQTRRFAAVHARPNAGNASRWLLRDNDEK